MARRNKEDKLQIAVTEALYILENTGIITTFFMIPNGVRIAGNTSRAKAIYMRILKAMGFRSGVSDMQVVFKDRVVYLELKVPGEKLEEYQEIFRDKIKTTVHEYHILEYVEDLNKILRI